jgi:ABC-2 type transport system ATP-binding protein
MITINNLKKTFRKYTILDIDNLVIGDNEKVAIVGKNGVGKTTLCEIIMGTQAPTSGKIETSIDDLRKNAVFQETGFSNDVNIYSIAKFYQDIFRARDFDLDASFEKYEIADLKKRRYNRLSGGQKQKFKLLISQLNQPNLLLLDELTTSLDYEWRQKIFKILNQMSHENKATILLISHDPEEIGALCDRVIILKDTKIFKDFTLKGDAKERVELVRKELAWDETAI